MFAIRVLTGSAIGLSLLGIAFLTWLDNSVESVDLIRNLNAIDANYQALANGLFMLIGVFWVGAVDTTRRWLEPKQMDPIIRFSVLAFAASYLLRLVFPCADECQAAGFSIQNSLVWLLYLGPFVFAIRCWQLLPSKMVRQTAGTLMMVFVALQLDLFFLHLSPGLWQRCYEVLFCWLWWQFTRVAYEY